MLILPLHRPLTLATFPAATALLILLNVFVFAVLQAGDEAALRAAQQHYVQAGIARYEVPAYERYLEANRRQQDLAELRAIPAESRAAYVAMNSLTDVAFLQQLQAGELIESEEDLAAWRTLRPRYDELQSGVFTLRHILRSSEVDLWRMFSSAFLHANAMHLIGNMLFLAALGLLVEGALGAGRFLGVYLLGALGSSAISLAWRWGEAGGGLGASGAIAALMGAFCMVWGRQPVRFFYWVGVVFDYVRAPAIWLFPVWLGWELYNLLANPDMGVGFDAHAGGLVSGALLGAALVWTRQVRTDYIHEPEQQEARDERWAQAQAHLGRMQLAEADALLVQLQQEQPQRFDVALARYRVAVNGGQRGNERQRAQELLRLAAADSAQVRQQSEALRRNPEINLSLAERQQIARRWMQLGEGDAAEALLAIDSGEAAMQAGLAQLWFELGLHRREQHDNAGFLRAMQTVTTRFPSLPHAQKAKFLLENS